MVQGRVLLIRWCSPIHYFQILVYAPSGKYWRVFSRFSHSTKYCPVPGGLPLLRCILLYTLYLYPRLWNTQRWIADKAEHSRYKRQDSWRWHSHYPGNNLWRGFEKSRRGAWKRRPVFDKTVGFSWTNSISTVVPCPLARWGGRASSSTCKESQGGPKIHVSQISMLSKWDLDQQNV